MPEPAPDRRGAADEERVDEVDDPRDRLRDGGVRQPLPEAEQQDQDQEPPDVHARPRSLTRAASGRLERLRLRELLAEHVPEGAELPGVLVRLADPDDVARARELDLVHVLDAAGPPRQDDDAVGERDGLGEVVGHEDDGLPPAGPELQELGLEAELGVGVERAERLVHQEDLGLDHERADQRHALAHAARQGRREGVLEPLEPHQPDGLPDPPLALGAGDAPVDEAELDVLGDGAPGEDRVLLEDVAHLARDARWSAAVQPDRARGRGDQARDHVEDGGLAAAGRAHEGDELLVPHLERHAGDGVGHAAAGRERLAEVADLDPDARGRGQDRCDAFRTKDMSTAFWKGMGPSSTFVARKIFRTSWYCLLVHEEVPVEDALVVADGLEHLVPGERVHVRLVEELQDLALRRLLDPLLRAVARAHVALDGGRLPLDGLPEAVADGDGQRPAEDAVPRLLVEDVVDRLAESLVLGRPHPFRHRHDRVELPGLEPPEHGRRGAAADPLHKAVQRLARPAPSAASST